MSMWGRVAQALSEELAAREGEPRPFDWLSIDVATSWFS